MNYLTKALSVNDAYWIENMALPQKWEEINLYHHKIDEILAYVAFTGYSQKVSGLSTSSEPTTNGIQKKSWTRHDNSICL